MKKEVLVAVSGYFDPIHVGHLEYLQMAKSLGDILVVIVNNNRQCILKKDKFVIAKKIFNSRLIVGTGKYRNMMECAKAVKLSGADIVTVAVRRVNISNKKKPLLMDYIDPKKIT